MYEARYDPESSALFFADGPPVEGDPFAGGRHVFVCGALQQPEKMAGLLGRRPPFAPAVVRGYLRTSKEVAGKTYPLMSPAPGDAGRVLTGVVWLGFSEEEIRRVESLELEGGVRKRVEITVLVGERTLRALTYVER